MKSQYLREQLKALPIVLVFLAFVVGCTFAPRIAFGAVSGILFLLAITMLVEDCLLASRGQRAQGKIVDHKTEEGCFLPVVEFRDRQGAIRRETTRSGRGVKSPAVGSRVVVLYDPAGRSTCELDSFARRWGVALIVGAFGSIFAIGAICW